MPEQSADLVERVVFVAAVAEGVLLDAAADLVDDLGAEPDHVEGVQHRDRVGQLVSDGVGVAAERVQRGLLNLPGEPVRLVVQPPLVGGAGPADDGVEQLRMQASVLVTGEIDHDGHSPVGADPRRPPVGSARGAVTALPLFRFPGPPAEPAVRFSPQRALHGMLLPPTGVWLMVSTGSGCGIRGSGIA